MVFYLHRVELINEQVFVNLLMGKDLWGLKSVQYTVVNLYTCTCGYLPRQMLQTYK